MELINDSCVLSGVLTMPKPWWYQPLFTKGFSLSPLNVKFLHFTWLATSESYNAWLLLLVGLDWTKRLNSFQRVHFLWWFLSCDQIWYCIKWHQVIRESITHDWIRDKKFKSVFSSSDFLWNWDSELNSNGRHWNRAYIYFSFKKRYFKMYFFFQKINGYFKIHIHWSPVSAVADTFLL